MKVALSCFLTALLAWGNSFAASTTPTAPTAPTVLPPQTTSSLRGIWVDAFGPGLKNRAQVMKTVEDASRLGVNTLFVQAIRRGDCLCLRAGLPLMADKDVAKGFDPLSEITYAAHARGMRVIAWVSITGAANLNVPNPHPSHVFKLHGPQSGAASWLSKRPNGSYQDNGDAWLDPAIPAAADFMVQGVVNLVKNYPVDGIQLDRIRYPDGGNWGYDPKTLARYRQETGAKGTPLPTDPRWRDWKREQVTALVRRVALETKALRPDLWVSAATITYGIPPKAGDLAGFRATPPYQDVLQDWPRWMREGLVDLNVLMNYKRETIPAQVGWFDGWNAFAHSIARQTPGAEIASGSALYLNSPQHSAKQATRTVAAGLGWVGYSYRTPSIEVYRGQHTTAQGLQVLGKVLQAPGNVLSTRQSWVSLPRNTRGILGKVVGRAAVGGLKVEAVREGQIVARGVTDGNGYYGFLNLPAGPLEVRVGTQRWSESVPTLGIIRYPDILLTK